MPSPRRVRFALLLTFAALLLPLTGARAQGGPLPVAIPLCSLHPDGSFSAKAFSSPTRIDNKWFPLVPGTQLTLQGQVQEGEEAVSHRVVFTVTDLTKVINGVRTVVVWDVDYNGDHVAEREITFFAQDDLGNVWNLGEYPEEFEDGAFTGAPKTWIAGQAGAQAGIHMLAVPVAGGERYLQGWAPTVDFLDCAQVFARVEKTCVTAGCYSDILVTDETSPLDPTSGHQRKYHAPGIGIIQIGAVGDAQAETLSLIKVAHLGPAGMAQARAAALNLDSRAYRNSTVYRQTAHAVAPALKPIKPVKPAKPAKPAAPARRPNYGCGCAR